MQPIGLIRTGILAAPLGAVAPVGLHAQPQGRPEPMQSDTSEGPARGGARSDVGTKRGQERWIVVSNARRAPSAVSGAEPDDRSGGAAASAPVGNGAG